MSVCSRNVICVNDWARVCVSDWACVCMRYSEESTLVKKSCKKKFLNIESVLICAMINQQCKDYFLYI